MYDRIAEIRPQLADLCRRHHVRRLAIFGSAIRPDFDPARSDIDLLVDFQPMPIESYFDNKAALLRALSRLFGRNVDLLARSSIRNPYLLREVEATDEQLYAA